MAQGKISILLLSVSFFVAKCKIAWNLLLLLGTMGLRMVEVGGVEAAVVVVVEDIEIEDLDLFRKNLRLQRLSVDFHLIRFKEILM